MRLTGAGRGSEEAERWFRPLADRSGTVRLFCFHHAGGAASTFRDWAALLPPFVEPVAVQLPGREGRFREPLYDRMQPLVCHLADAIEPFLDRPYACFGYSMGARVSFRLAQVLRARGLRTPEMLFLAASPGPSLTIPIRGWNEPDEGLVAYLRDLGGVAPELLRERELLELLLPVVRADLTVVATWPYAIEPPLACPLHVFAGDQDDYAAPERMRAWERETAGGLRSTVFPGGHFFLHSELPALVAAVSEDLRGYGG